MNKIFLIIQREYITRVKKKTFILLTLLAPVLYGLLIMLPILASKMGKETKTVAVVDESGKFQNIASSNKNLVIYNTTEQLSEVEKGFKADKENFYILHVPKDFDIFKPAGIELISPKHVGIFFKSTMDSMLENRINTLRMIDLKIPQSSIDSLHAVVDIKINHYTKNGIVEESSGATTGAAYAGGFLIYIFIFLYGTMVTRGVQEEKQSRVVEIIISSVKPFQLMMGKIIGIALVGLTQFAIWILLTIAITTITGHAVAGNHMAQGMGGPAAQNQGGVQDALSALGTLHIPVLIATFLFYFIGGYLLYSSFFASVASAVDSQSDMGQFILPISLPIVFSIASLGSVIENPDGPLAFWMSMIPLTSPIVMMARIPFENFSGDSNFTWQLILSMAILIGSFILSTWIAGKIYRIGILMYGKKITWKELGKWVFYRG
jgi:ABC-2 type transport system permease protein